MDAPRHIPFCEIAALRGPRATQETCEGLWCSGDLRGLGRPSVAIVGTRAATPYGKHLAHRFAAEIGAAGCCIISGLALGIDAAAHEGALAANALTIGILGSGHRQFFPSKNLPLAERMVLAGGAVLSPFAPEQPAYPGQFLERNGVVAGLADAVVVIEAPARSGALNTAGWAAGSIPVFAVPGDVDRPHVQGCLALIRDGATLARNAADVLAQLRLTSGPMQLPLPAEQPRGALQQAILAALHEGERAADELADSLDFTPAQILATLAMLEIEGAIERRGRARYGIAS